MSVLKVNKRSKVYDLLTVSKPLRFPVTTSADASVYLDWAGKTCLNLF